MTGFALLGLWLNGSRAWVASLRRKPNTLPCRELVPDLVWLATTPAMACPNSAS